MSSGRIFLVCAVGLSACGGHVVSGAQPTETDSGTTPEIDSGTTAETEPVDADEVAPPLDHGAPSDTYPAFATDMPQLKNNGGGILKSPVIVTVTFPGDTNATSYEAFGDGIGATQYWKSITSEYGVTPAISGVANHVRATETLAASMSDGDLENYVYEHVSNYAKYGWAAPTDQSIYTLYIPSATKVSYFGKDTCSSGIGGYHSSLSVGSMSVAFAIVLQCKYGTKATTPRTSTASHELGEATTDPFATARGYDGVDGDHIAWHYFMENKVENGDMCEIYVESRYSDTIDAGFAYYLQRQWSNASAKAGHNPCVPAPVTVPYFNVTPLDQESLTVNALSARGLAKQPTMGYHIAIGETKTFAVGFWSDGPSDAWKIGSTEVTAFGDPAATTKRLDVKIDKTSGRNGEKAYVTVTVLSTAGARPNLLTITSTSTTTRHYRPILISSL